MRSTTTTVKELDDSASGTEVTVADHLRKSNASNATLASSHTTTRVSRTVSYLVGIVTLGLAVLGLVLLIDHKDYSLRRPPRRHANYQGTVTMAERAAHAVPEDCWMEIHGKVYDLTEYADEHPGGPEYITDYCGMNATRAYDLEHSTGLLTLIRRYNLGDAVVSDTVVDASNGGLTGTNANVPSTHGEDSSEDDSEDDSDDEDREDDVGSYNAPPTIVAANTPVSTPATSSQCAQHFYSTATVAQHNTRDDCWYILYNYVWDFTTYVDEHPGGARRVFQYCGMDATGPYQAENKHTISLLQKEVPHLRIGLWGEVDEVQYHDC